MPLFISLRNNARKVFLLLIETALHFPLKSRIGGKLMKNNKLPELRNLGSKIEDIRKSSGKSQERFAADYGVAQGTLSKYESGQTNPPVALLVLICRDYRINPNYFFDWDDETLKRMGMPPQSKWENIFRDPEVFKELICKWIDVMVMRKESDES